MPRGRHTINKIKPEQLFSKKDMRELGEKWWMEQVEKIRNNQSLIKRGYSVVTQKRRERFGLQTSFVDLTGNRRYSKKQWRMLNQGKVSVTKKKEAVVYWKRNDAAKLWKYHLRRYGKII